MKNLLSSFLEKVGVKDYSDLTEPEKATYKEWERILSHEVRIEDVAKFLEGQVRQLNKKLREATRDGEDRQALYIAAKIENYEAVIFFINEPLERRKTLEKELLNNVQ